MIEPLNAYAIKISSSINEICLAAKDAIQHITREFGISDECALFQIKVVINELLINAVLHGNNCQPKKSVKMRILRTDNGFLDITVEDEGNGFNYDYLLERCVDACDCDVEEAMETGRGMLIVKNLSEQIIFNNKGNKVTAIIKM